MNSLKCQKTHQMVALTERIAISGEGEVWRTNRTGQLAKIYHTPTVERIAKLRVMIAHPPRDPNRHQHHCSYAWPQSLLERSGVPVGFLMPEIRDSQELINIYTPKVRNQLQLEVDWRFLHVTALNVVSLIARLHEEGYVLGDIKPQNILVNRQALPAIIDTDSFQVRHPQIGELYHCPVGSPDFTPPELMGQDLDQVEQRVYHDAFRIGVIVHLLLFGQPPFSGVWTGLGERPQPDEMVRRGLWVYGSKGLIQPGPTTIPLEVVHRDVQRLFMRCFNEGHQNPVRRPGSKEWLATLKAAVGELTVCDQKPGHIYAQHYRQCYWCERAAQLGVDIFDSPVFATRQQLTGSVSSFSSPAQTISTMSGRSTVNPVSAPQPLISMPAPTPQAQLQSPSGFRTSLLSRQKFLKWAGLGGGGLVLALVGREIVQMREAPSPINIKLHPFTFESVSVNDKGEETARRSGQAQSFKEDLGNGVELEMVSIPSGSFTMGSPENEKDRRANEGPQRTVNVPAFFMGKFAVTQAQWKAISQLPGVTMALEPDPSRFKGSDLPVERVSWNEAVEFCHRLSRQMGRSYRLPSEAEWEYACRAGTLTPFHTGATLTSELANYDATSVYRSEAKGEYRGQTTPVGGFLPNAFGLYDMHGNVWEWCADHWHGNYQDAPTDGSAWTTGGDSSYRLLRGGSWSFNPRGCRSAYRLDFDPGPDTLGFRVVCEVPRILP